ncbi:MAG: hypothetical protein IPK77_10660 [Cellvibrio sp.]|nr:hypothetical protein [Cellvibrio sp.]
MATPLTAQIGRPERVDLGAALIGGMQNYQSMQGQKLQNQAMQQDVSQGDFAMNLRNLQIMNSLAKKAKTIPLEQRPMFRDQQMQLMQSIGIDPSQMAQAPLDDASLDQWIGQSDAVLASVMPQRKADIGTYNPRDYTPESWAEFVQTQDAGKLKRYESNRVVRIGGVDYLVDTATGERTPISSLQEVAGNVEAVSGAGERGKLKEQLETKPKIETAVTGAKDKVIAASEAADRSLTLEAGLGVYDKLVEEIDNGANTSVYTSWTPTIKDTTKRFEQGARELGLGVISNTTFGALSAPELKLAMETAVPQLQPAAMRQWLLDKKAAQQKLADQLFLYAEHLENGGTKVTWIKKQKEIKGQGSANNSEKSDVGIFTSKSGIQFQVK